MIRISYDWDRDFDEQWDEMIASKKAKDMTICSWQKHLQKQERWVSHLPQVHPEWIPLYGSGTSDPLTSKELTSISAVAFSLFGDQTGCFFSFRWAIAMTLVPLERKA